MLSKQEKLKHAEFLRKQIQEAEEKKRMQRDLKRGIHRSPTDNRIPPTVINNHSYHENPKQNLQTKFQKQDLNYYGRPGAGAPNPQPVRQPAYNNYPEQLNIQPKQNRIHQPYDPYYQQNQQRPNRMNTYESMQNTQQNHAPTSYNYQPQRDRHPSNYQQQNLPYPYQQNQRNYKRQYEPQYYPPQQNNGPPQQPQNLGPPPIPNHQRYPTQRSVEEPSNYRNIYPPMDYGHPPKQFIQSKNYRQPYKNVQEMDQRGYGGYGYNQQVQQVEQGAFDQPLQQINEKHTAFKQKTLENEQLMEIHKKGGRNLLQLQNMGIEQQQIKIKQKQQMRKQLEMQMKEAENKKQRQKERIRREEEQEERKNQEYLRQQKQRVEEEERKKNQKQREIIEQNLRNLEERKKLEEEAKEKAKRQKFPDNKSSKPMSPRMKYQENFSRQAQNQLPMDQTTSEVSSSTVMEKGFKTDISKEFFEKERRKNQEKYNRQKNLEVVTDEIERLKEQIERQNDLFKKEIQKVKMESEMAEHEKLRAQQEIEDLKSQLKRKMEDDNERLFKALQKQEKLKYQVDEYEPPRQRNHHDEGDQIVSLKPPKKEQKKVLKKYKVNEQPHYNPLFEQSNVSEEGLISLKGQSKKIPINLPNDKLTMSEVSQFARETQYFKNDGRMPKAGHKKSTLDVHNSIIEEEEDKGGQSRNVKRKQSAHQHKDQLDKMLESRQKSRGGWGQMSSVNSDITKQIQDLLRKKDQSSKNHNYGYNNYQNGPDYSGSIASKNSRPPSNLSNAGKRALSRDGIAYEGASLNTINSQANGTLNTFDVEKINNRNEARLNQFRKLGVQTINSNNDGELTKLDEILNRYKQGKKSRAEY